jgi:hypothetical protein
MRKWYSHPVPARPIASASLLTQSTPPSLPFSPYPESYFFPTLHSFNKSSKSSSSPQAPFLLLTTIFSVSLLSATAPSNSFNCSSVTLALNCPLLAKVINRFSTSWARDSLTSRMRPSRSAASGSRIWERMDLRASASCSLGKRDC